MDLMILKFWIELISNSLTIITAILALYLFFKNKEKISSAINFLLNYSKQISITDLKFKIERLNDYTSNDQEQKKEIINLLSDIEGQINGNYSLKKSLENQLHKINNFLENPKTLSEPKKRSLVSELRESIRNIDVSNYQNIIRSNNNNG
ncbi:hypothetical protein ACLB9Y_10750 [Chryseobacterium scophthalmum]|uniref:hypothetical protein n=1 Tax=Chryseobacterium scophthalmum TaxID=59733 RepID=UPI00398B3F0F